MRIWFWGLDVDSIMSQTSTNPLARPTATTEDCHGDHAADWMAAGRGGNSRTGPSYKTQELDIQISEM